MTNSFVFGIVLIVLLEKSFSYIDGSVIGSSITKEVKDYFVAGEVCELFVAGGPGGFRPQSLGGAFTGHASCILGRAVCLCATCV